MKHCLRYLVVVLALSAALLASAADDIQTFNFTLTEMTAITGKQVGTGKSDVYTIEVNIYGPGYANVLVGMKNFKLGEWKGKWTSDGDALSIGSLGSSNYLVISGGNKCVINLVQGEKTLLWAEPQSEKTYKSQLTRMLTFLRRNGLVTTKGSSTAKVSDATQSEKASAAFVKFGKYPDQSGDYALTFSYTIPSKYYEAFSYVKDVATGEFITPREVPQRNNFWNCLLVKGLNNSTATHRLRPSWLPETSPSKPFTFELWVYLRKEKEKDWVGKQSMGTFVWDGKTIRRDH